MGLISQENLESLAKETGFMKRQSKIGPKDFLETVFFSNASSCPSLSQYGANMLMNLGKKVSKQALHKRFKSNAKEFMGLLVGKLMQSQLTGPFTYTGIQGLFTEIRVMDSSEFVIPPKLADAFPGYGGKGREAIAQLQFEYELTQNKVTRLSLGNGLDSDLTEGLKYLDQIPEKSLLIRDMGYVSLDFYSQLIDKGLYFISRLKTQLSIFEKQDGVLRKLLLTDIIEKLQDSPEKYLDIEVFIGSKEKLPVRLTANLLSENQKEKRLLRKRLNKGSNKVTAQHELEASVNIFVTNVKKDQCDAEKIYQLYKLRWQIELVFKTWKSILRIHNAHPMNVERFECVMYVKMLWVLLNWSLVSTFSIRSGPEFSLYKLTNTVVHSSHNLMTSLQQGTAALQVWLQKLFDASVEYNVKEYKKGTPSIAKILSITHLKTDVYDYI